MPHTVTTVRRVVVRVEDDITVYYTHSGGFTEDLAQAVIFNDPRAASRIATATRAAVLTINVTLDEDTLR